MAGLTAEQLRHFDEFGYVKVEKLMPQRVLDDLIAEYGTVLDTLAEDLHAEGEIESTYEELPFGERLTRIYMDTGKGFAQYFDFHLPGSATEEDTPFWTGPAVFRALTEPRLIDVVENLIGPEVYSNPVQHVRIKPPEDQIPIDGDYNPIIKATPWHQDHGVVMPEADETNMLTVWFPLLDAPVESGCLQLIPKSHRRELLTHCTGEHGHPRPGPVPGTGQRHPGADGSRRRPVHAPAHLPRFPVQRLGPHPLELRRALQPDRPAHGQGLPARVRGPQPPGSRDRVEGSGRVGSAVARYPCPPGRPALRRHHDVSVGWRSRGLRLSDTALPPDLPGPGRTPGGNSVPPQFDAQRHA